MNKLAEKWIEAYSAIINKAKLNPEYSIKYPEDNSASDSETSKGTFLISVNIIIHIRILPSNEGKINHKFSCSNTIDKRLKDCAHIAGISNAKPIVIP